MLKEVESRTEKIFETLEELSIELIKHINLDLIRDKKFLEIMDNLKIVL